MCGQRYDPDQNLACRTCPMHQGCTLVCCPACGYQTVNPRRSKLVQLVQLILAPSKATRISGSGVEGITLVEVPVGCEAKVVGFAADFPPDRKAHLQAYGLVPNYRVRVVQRSAVTIIRLDHIELALENDLARGINVQVMLNNQLKD
jgi:Fe2+ transport system protein FeoA